MHWKFLRKCPWDLSSPGEWKEETNSGQGEARLSWSLGGSLTPGGSKAGRAFHSPLSPASPWMLAALRGERRELT